MNLSRKIQTKFEALLAEGMQLLNENSENGKWNGKELHDWPGDHACFRWRTEALNLLRQVCGEASPHYKTLQKYCDGTTTDKIGRFFPSWYGILEAARKDFEDEFLNLRGRVRAELVDDFITQAEQLLEDGMHVAAVQLVGAVLEDSLRKLCDYHAIAYAPRTTIDALNSDLARKNVYTKLVQKQITAHADLRNTAAHGHFQKVPSEDAKEMVAWVRRFVTEYVT